uniref:Uncharacterized protein n=1 Tax=Fagus sylvatica TaxID=28930 RepID=A0A2N9I9Q2_FAGSY
MGKVGGTFQRNPERPKSLKPSDLLPPSSGLRDRPSPPCEGDRDQRWSDPGRVARFRFVFLFFSFYYVISPFSLLSTTRSEGPESPPPPLPSPTFRSTSHPSDLAVYGGDLLETLGDLSLHRHLSLRSARFCHSNGSRDPLRRLMLGGHRIWRSLPARPSLDPNFGVDFLKLFLKSPSTPESHGLSCHDKIDSTMVYLAGITAPDLLLLQTLIVVVALELFRKM